MKEPLPGCGRGLIWEMIPLPHLPGFDMEPAGIGTVSRLRYPLAQNGCRGFIGPVPPPLWMRELCGRALYACARRMRAESDERLYRMRRLWPLSDFGRRGGSVT